MNKKELPSKKKDLILDCEISLHKSANHKFTSI
jgi:hypothetical protein